MRNFILPCVIALLLSSTGCAAAPRLSARWIWRAGEDVRDYNQTVIARRTFTLAKPVAGTLRITADSFYRVSINGQWVNDGPSRAWPEHFQYDVLDVGHYLRDGENTIEVIARYFGVGDFHRVPQQAGLLAQLDAKLAGGASSTLITDESWEIADVKAMPRNTPKISIQMSPAELFDARLADDLKFSKARVLYPADGGPWKNLNARDVALLTRQPFAFRAFGGAKLVKAEGMNFCLPAVRLMHPQVIEANHNATAPCGMATILETEKGCTINPQQEGMKLAIAGKLWSKGPVQLAPGRHLVVAFVRSVIGHDKEKSVRFMDPRDFRLINPLDANHANPWCFIPLPDYRFVGDDIIHGWFLKENTKVNDIVTRYHAETDRLLGEVKTPEEFAATLAGRSKLLAPQEMFVEDSFWQFTNRRIVGDAAKLVNDPAALMHDTPAATHITPSPDGDVELMYDLGEQNCGYWTFDLVAPAGVIVDIFAVEYIAPDGRVQFPWGNRNGLRYITREGVNRFTSLKRRSGRNVFMTLRNQSGPVSIRHFGLVESTYPVNYIGSFSCSDARLDRIWEISTRTLKLCMEDTFTDCPLYEQTHWVGDARNEALMAYPVFGAADLGRRCIRITAESLDRYPFAGSQTPTCWDVMIPAWSFLWGISTWDYYWYTGDKAFLREIYPAVIRNIKGAEKYVNDQGLIAGPFWNFFDWTKIDQQHHAVLHNSMLMVGAIDAALLAGKELEDATHIEWLRSLRTKLVAGVNKLWDPQKQAYVDSVHADGKPSASTSQHTSFLSVLYDIVTPANLPAARKNMTDPPDSMIRIGAPFAALYLYEAFEKLGMDDRIVDSIYRNYLPMLEAGATTVWESFPSGTTGSGGFPTRSHTHAWSSAPSYFLNRIILGIRPTSPGARTVQISPRLSGLIWARGTIATTQGPISVAWQLKKDGALDITCTAPESVKVEFVKNDSHPASVSFNRAK